MLEDYPKGTKPYHKLPKFKIGDTVKFKDTAVTTNYRIKTYETGFNWETREDVILNTVKLTYIDENGKEILLHKIHEDLIELAVKPKKSYGWLIGIIVFIIWMFLVDRITLMYGGSELAEILGIVIGTAIIVQFVKMSNGN